MLEPAADGVYYISSAEELKEFANKVNDTSGQYTDIDAVLTANIDLSSVCSEEEGDSWTPIGSDSNEYTGTFNGDGHTISGLTINNSSANYQGLFGYVGTGGKVQNLTVSGTVSGGMFVGGVVGYNNGGTVTGCIFSGSGSVSGNSYVGGVVGVVGVVGDSSGTVKNCYNTGDVTGGSYVGGVVGQNSGSVENCYNTGNISGDISVGSSGGVVGWNSGTVENCYNTGSVTSSGSNVGGVVGYNVGPVKNCYNIGEVSGSGIYVGGVVGYNGGSGIVTNCYNTGTVSSNSNISDVGGVVGYNGGSGTVTNCYNTGTVSSNSNIRDVGSVVGLNGGSGTVTGCYFLTGTAGSGIGGGIGNARGLTADEFKNQISFTDWDFGIADTWSIHPVLGRPVLNENKEGGNGSPDSPYEISTADELENFRDIVNGTNGQVKDSDAHAKLMNDIDLNPNMKIDEDGTVTGNPDQWTPIGNIIDEEDLDSFGYSGTFDGNGHTISGLYIDSSTNDQGLFGCLDQGGTVKDLSVSGNVSGNNFVGGVVGLNRGSVENCYNTGEVSGNSVGGVVGYNGGTVENCYNTGNISGNTSGGVVGYNHSGGSVTNSYNTGSVSGNNYVGGVVGGNSGSSTVTGCYFLQTETVNTKLQGIGENDGSGDATATEKDDTAFQSGEVAYLLQSKQTDESGLVWGQNIKDGKKDNYPQLRAFDADTPQVYRVAFMNDSEEHDAKYANSGMTVDLPATEPTKEGYTFSYWQDKAGTQVTKPISVNSDTTYYAKWTPHTYSITASPSALDFGSITEGEERPAAQTVTVKNTGNQTVPLNQPTATNFEIAKIDDLALDAGESVKLTIQPKDKLPRGSYSEQIVVSNTNDEKAAITATFTVKEPPYTGKYSYEVFTSVGDNGTISVDRYATEGDKVTIDVTPDQAYKLDELVVTANGKDVELTANSDGTYTFTMPSADVRITATFAEDPDWTPDEPEEPTTDVSDLFIDVTPDAWYKDAVQYAYDNGLMTGVSANEFAPEQTTTRAMIVSILARLENVTSAESAGFADVAANDWYATAVNWAANVGVVNGYEDNTFRPNQPITREQLAAILMNYAAYKGEDVSNRASLATYTDQPSTWAEETMSWAVAEGLISGVTADTLQPQGAATRAQVAAILQRFLSE